MKDSTNAKGTFYFIFQEAYFSQCRYLKVPVRSNFPKFMFVHFLKVYVAVIYQAKQFFNPSTGSPFYLAVFLAILRPPLIGHVPTAQ